LRTIARSIRQLNLQPFTWAENYRRVKLFFFANKKKADEMPPLLYYGGIQNTAEYQGGENA
jgi:hypothetical protein